MYIWRLLLVLILSILQPILSEKRLIDGRESCTYLSRSTCADEIVSLPEKRQTGQLIPKNRRLNEPHEIRFNNHRYEVRDAKVLTTLSSRERHSRRLDLALNRRNRVAVERQEDLTIRDTSKNVLGERYMNTLLNNGRDTYNSLHFKLSHEDTECANSGRQDKIQRNIFKQDLIKESDEVLGRTRAPLDQRESFIIRNNDRNVRQLYTHRVRSTDVARGHEAYIWKDQNSSMNKERYTRDILRKKASIEGDTHQKNLAPIKDRHITCSHNTKTSESLNDTNGMTKKDTNNEVERTISRISERLSGHTIHKRTIRSDNDVRQSDARRKEHERITPSRDERYVNTRDDITARNNERYAKDDNAKRVISMKYYLDEQDTRQVTNDRVRRSLSEQHTNGHTGLTNYETYARDSTRKSIAIEQSVRQQESRALRDIRKTHRNEERNTNIRKPGADTIRNMETNSRDDHRFAKHQSDARRIMEKNIVRNREDRNLWAKNRESINRNTEVYERNLSIKPLERDVRQNAQRVTDRHESQNRATRNTNESIDLENRERYAKDNYRTHTEQNIRIDNKRNSRDGTRQIVMTNKLGRGKSDVRTSNEHSAYIILERSKNSPAFEERYRVLDRYVFRSEGERRSNVREHRSQIVPDTRCSWEQIRNNAVSVERSGHQSNARRVIQEHLACFREEKNLRTRDENTNVRNAGRSTRDVFHERTVVAQHNIRQSSDRRFRDRDDAQRYRLMDMTSRNKHDDNRKTEKYMQNNNDKRTGSVQRQVPKSDLIRSVDEYRYIRAERKSNLRTEQTLMNQEHETRKSNINKVSDNLVGKQNANVRGLLIDISNDERYSRTNMRDRVLSVERNIRVHQSEERIINNKHVGSGHEEQNTRSKDERKDIIKSKYYARDNIRAHRTIAVEREIRLQDLKRITDNYTVRIQTLNMNVRNVRLAEIQGRGLTEKQRRETYSVRSRTDSRTVHSRRMTAVRTIPNSDSQRYRTKENLQLRESKETPLLTSTFELYQDREANNKAYVSLRERNTDLERDHSRRNTEFASDVSDMAGKKAFALQNEITKNESNMLLYWQYFFYAIQGIYIFVVFKRVFRQKEQDKTSSRSWLTSTRFIKVD